MDNIKIGAQIVRGEFLSVSPTKLTAYSIICCFLIYKISQWIQRRNRLVKIIEKIPGPPVHPWLPWLGHTIVILYLDSQQYQFGTYVLIYQMIAATNVVYPHQGICRMWLGMKPFVLLYSAENVECILSSVNLIDKASEYRFLQPWLGHGLVTSSRLKWRQRRKILTPAFHFQILTDFLPIINEEATCLVEKVASKLAASSRRSSSDKKKNVVDDDDDDDEGGFCTDLTPLITMCTLDTICETAMGIKINCQQSDQSHQYVDSLHELGELILVRVMRPWLWPDSIFYLTPSGRRFKRCLKQMHKFTMEVIVNRKRAWQEQLKLDNVDDRSTDATGALKTQCNHSTNAATTALDYDLRRSGFFAEGQNRRLAFLDLLLQQHLITNTLTLDDVREEVDTFMFAGHDTTAMAISWTLYMLGLHEDIQERVREEIDSILGPDDEADKIMTSEGHQSSEPGDQWPVIITTNVTSEHLRHMKYLDCVLKEVQRLWPTAPFIARQINEDVQVPEGYTIPQGSTCVIFTHMLHRNPKYFPRPEVFNPDRFSPENSLGRHPFAYVPFSAGPRNCIGQKFAQMEQKVIVAKFVRNFHIKALEPRDKLVVVGEMVLRTRNGLNVRLLPRRHPHRRP